jgi:hypothetical protein
VCASSLLHHRDGLSNLSINLKEARQDDCVGKVACIDLRFHLTDQAKLRIRQDRYHSLLAEISQDLVQLQY